MELYTHGMGKLDDQETSVHLHGGQIICPGPYLALRELT